MTAPDVFATVGELVRVQRLDVEYLPGKTYRAYAPCRLAQLADAVAASTSGSGGHSKPGSRIPIAAGQLDLYRDIVIAINLWAYALGVDRRPYQAGVPTGSGAGKARFETPPIGRLLNRCAGEAMRLRRYEMADRMTRDARSWSARIDAMLPRPKLRPDGSMIGRAEVTSIRGRTCPMCGAMDVPEDRPSDLPDDPPETYRVPALQLSYADLDGQEWPYWWCRVDGCGAWDWLREPAEIREAS